MANDGAFDDLKSFGNVGLKLCSITADVELTTPDNVQKRTKMLILVGQCDMQNKHLIN